MFRPAASKIAINPRDYQDFPRKQPLSPALDKLVDPSYASTKDPIAVPPLSLYDPIDGSINHLNHYYYYHHLTHFDALDGAHRDLYDEFGNEIPHYHHPVSSINLEDIVKFGRQGITFRRSETFRSSSCPDYILEEPGIVRCQSPDYDFAPDPRRIPYKGKLRARRLPREVRPGSASVSATSSHTPQQDSELGFKRYFSFNWRVILPKT
ncbi:hypothetical protein V1511DRAFT_445359, partial [Dipodascopsis uninucleata]